MCLLNIQAAWQTKPSLAASTLINSLFAWLAHQADSWWLCYMKNSDIIITDTEGQALDILPQCAQSAQKKIMVETYIHSYIQSHIQTENNKIAKTKTHQT